MPLNRRLFIQQPGLFCRRPGNPKKQIQLSKEREEGKYPPIKAFLEEPCFYPSRDVSLPDLHYFNGFGGFSRDGKEYIIHLKEGLQTPAPWINVVANKKFGFLISESGSGSTWAENSRENKLTPWSNDPVSDPSGEAIYLRDEKTGEVWTITPLPIREKEPYLIRHGIGYTSFHHESHGLDQKLTCFVPLEDSEVEYGQFEKQFGTGKKPEPDLLCSSGTGSIRSNDPGVFSNGVS